jgi:hypothetical protein
LFLALSEFGLYAGLKDSPAFTMFAGLRVKSCMPNHYIARDRLLSSYFYRDLLFVSTAQDKRIGIPLLSLRAKWDRSRRYGAPDPLVENYRNSTVTRMRAGVEEPFKFEDLDNIKASSWIEVVLPRRLFFLEPAAEEDLRCSMPDLFTAAPRSPIDR